MQDTKTLVTFTSVFVTTTIEEMKLCTPKQMFYILLDIPHR